MKSIRLNKDLRAEIASNIEQAYVIKNPEPEKPDPMGKLLDNVEVIYRKRAQTLLDKAASAGIPPNHLKRSPYFSVVNNEGEYSTRYLTDSAQNRQQDIPQVNPKSTTFLSLTCPPEEDKELLEVITQYKADRKAERPKQLLHTQWVKDKSNYMADVNNVLVGVNTTGQLLEVWEECEKFLPVGIVNPSKINLPSVNISQLNKKI